MVILRFLNMIGEEPFVIDHRDTTLRACQKGITNDTKTDDIAISTSTTIIFDLI